MVRHWIVSRRVWCIHFGTPCKIWSVASPAESSEQAAGFACAVVTLRLLRLCTRYKIHFSLENPASSALFRWPPFARFLRQHCVSSVVIHYCRWGASYLKPTRVVSSIAALDALETRCLGGHHHEHLQGVVKVQQGEKQVTMWKTSLAGAYPPALCHAWAKLLARVAPPSAAIGDRADSMSSHWEVDLCAATGLESAILLKCPVCPAKWVDLWPASTGAWGESWGPWIPFKEG